MLSINVFQINDLEDGCFTVDGKEYYFSTDFRDWVEYIVAVKCENAIRCYEILQRIVHHKQLTDGIIAKLIDYCISVEHRKPTTITVTNNRLNIVKTLLQGQSSKVLFDFEVDADCIIADFRREYNINLLDGELKLSWQHFKILLNNLSDNSSVEKRKQLRNKTSKDVSKENVQTLEEMQELYKINSNTREITKEERELLMKEYAQLVSQEARLQYEKKQAENNVSTL